MDALTILRREHTRIAQLFVEFDALPECACAGRRALVREIDELVRRHVHMERAFSHQRLCAAPEEHERVLGQLEEIARTDCHEPAYVPRVHVLRDLFADHIQHFAQVA